MSVRPFGVAAARPRDAFWVSLLCALTFGFMHQILVERAYPDALYMDSLRLLYQVHAWEDGRLSFVELWGLGSAHRGFINPLILLANVRIFSLDVLLANRLTGLVVGIVVFVLLFVYNRHWLRVDTAGWLVRFATSVLMGALCFSWAGFELFTLDLGLPLWIKNLCFLVFFGCHARYLAAGPISTSRWAMASAALSAAGTLIVMFIGMGWSYAFAGAVLAVQGASICVEIRARRLPLKDVAMRAAPLLCILLALAWSLAQGASGGHVEEDASFARVAGSVGDVGSLVLYALGGGWIGAETLAHYGINIDAATWFGLIGVLAGGWVLFDRFRRGLYGGSLLPLYLVAYGVMTALSLAAARGEGGAQAVMASRYYMDVVLFPIGILWMAAESVAATRQRAGAQLANFLVYSLLALSMVLAVASNGKREWAVAPYRALAFEAMNAALRDGVPDEAAAQLLQAPLEHARLGAVILRNERLSLFADGPAGPKACDPEGIVRAGDWSIEELNGRWMGESARLTVPFICECDLNANLFIPEGFSARELQIGEGEALRKISVEPGRIVPLVLPAHRNGRSISFEVSRTTTPSEEIGGSSDVRRLGVFWSGIGFSCRSEPSER